MGDKYGFRGPSSTVPHFSASTTQATNAKWLAVDSALDSVLRAAGSELINYRVSVYLSDMRAAMLEIMKAAYIEGSNDCHNSLNKYL